MLKLLKHLGSCCFSLSLQFFYVKDFLTVRRQERNLYFNEAVVADDRMPREL